LLPKNMFQLNGKPHVSPYAIVSDSNTVLCRKLCVKTRETSDSQSFRNV
jgi:hypothetical protein